MPVQTQDLADLMNFGRLPQTGGNGALVPPGGGPPTSTLPGSAMSPPGGGRDLVASGGRAMAPARQATGAGEKFMGQAQRVPPTSLPKPTSLPATAVSATLPAAARFAGGGALALYPKPAGEGSDVPMGTGAPGFTPAPDDRQYFEPGTAKPVVTEQTGTLGQAMMDWGQRRHDQLWQGQPSWADRIKEWVGEAVARNLDLGRQALGMPMQYFQPVEQPGSGAASAPGTPTPPMTAQEYYDNQAGGFAQKMQGPGLPSAEDYKPGEVGAASPFPTSLDNVQPGEGFATGQQNGQRVNYAVDATGNVRKTLNGQEAPMGPAGGRGGLTILEGDQTGATAEKQRIHEQGMARLRQGLPYDEKEAGTVAQSQPGGTLPQSPDLINRLMDMANGPTYNPQDIARQKMARRNLAMLGKLGLGQEELASHTAVAGMKLAGEREMVNHATAAKAYQDQVNHEQAKELKGMEISAADKRASLPNYRVFQPETTDADGGTVKGAPIAYDTRNPQNTQPLASAQNAIPKGYTPAQVIAEAKNAIAKGKSRSAVEAELAKYGLSIQ